MLRWLFVLLLIPFLDAVLLALVVSQTQFGWVAMVLFVVLTGLVGLLLVRAEGRRTIRKMQRSLAEGRPPTNELLDGGLLIASGAFLLTPGLVTDALGIALVIPLTRIPIRAGLKRFVIVPYLDKKADGFVSGNVWTVGFPGGAAGADFPGGSAGGDFESQSGQQSNESGGRDTYDLGEDDYTVDGGGSGGDGYRIDFGDPERSRGGDESDDPPAR